MVGIAVLVHLSGWAQTIPALDAPHIMAINKGPNQVNLSWSGVPNPGYGYLIEVQSDADSRYSSYTELQPIPPAGGYTCNPSVVENGATCNISDPRGTHVYNPITNGVPYWVTDATYIDPQDGSPAQFIAWGLKPNTSYSFRVRSYSGNIYGAYSAVATATTANYPVRYVSPTGNDSNDGTGPDRAHAWLTLAHGSSAIHCGQELIVMGGNYANDSIDLEQSCSAGNKAVVLVNPGDTATIAPSLAASVGPIILGGNYVVVDGITSASSTAYPGGGFDAVINGNHDALLNVNVSPAVIPSFSQGGVQINGSRNLIYRSYLHDYGSPDATQNPGGNGGFVLVLPSASSSNNVIWSNHLTRGGHDVSLCLGGCSYNRWLNNIMDGGWGMAWEAVFAGAQNNLVEGNFVKDVGQLITAYKPSFEISQGPNTLRRNISVNGKNVAVEVSALYGGSTVVGSLIYNNIFYNPNGCLFQSHNSGVTAYDYTLFANNICYKFPNEATDIYLDNTNSEIVYNSLLGTDPAGTPQPDRPIIIWAHDSGGSFQYPQTLAYADNFYKPPFSYNKGLDVVPQFVDEANLDFHLNSGSPLIGVGTPITDIGWGSSMGVTDIGAFGIVTSTDSAINVGPTITISPPGATLSTGEEVSFTAVVNGTPNNRAVSWSISPRVGGIADGVYVAPAAVSVAQTVTVTATSTADPTKTATATVNVILSPTQFVPVTPCRIADTRNPDGPFGGPAITGNTSRDFVIPSSICGIPSNAAAYSLNVAVVPHGTLGFLTLWPSGKSQPVTATLNSIDGRVKSNAAIVPAGSNGGLSVFATDTTDVILDINGYFVMGSNPSALAFYPLTPCRIADTRNAAGPLGGPSLAAQSTRSFPILASSCGLPANAQAYSLNFAAAPKGPILGFMTAWPDGQAQPLVASLNDPRGTVLANAVIVPAGAGGAVNVFTTDNTDLVIDINGYFAPQGPGGLSLYTVPPCRLLDSRLPAGTPPFSTTRDVNVTAASCGAPPTAQAIVFNATVVPPGSLGYITMWPQGQTQPLAATLNDTDGAVTNNMAIVPTTTGSISVFPFAPTHLVLDIFGYFAP